jgi:hypothetical protein
MSIWRFLVTKKTNQDFEKGINSVFYDPPIDTPVTKKKGRPRKQATKRKPTEPQYDFGLSSSLPILISEVPTL